MIEILSNNMYNYFRHIEGVYKTFAEKYNLKKWKYRIDLDNEDYGFLKDKLGENKYIDLDFLYSTLDNSMGNLTQLCAN